MSAKTVFFQASSSARRNVSLGPGVTLEGSVGRDYRVSSETTHDDGDNSDSDEQAQHNSDTYSPPARPHSLDHAYSRHHRYPPVSHVEPRVVTSPTSDEEHEPVAMTPLITSVTASPVMSPVLELDGCVTPSMAQHGVISIYMLLWQCVGRRSQQQRQTSVGLFRYVRVASTPSHRR